jgi:menaquinone-9 beta-reductase
VEPDVSVWDAVVIGAGPGGAAAALGLAREGARVLLVDRERFPRWKVCGACVGPAAVARLESMGLEGVLARRDAVPLSHLRLACGGQEARISLRGNVALSRSVLDQELVDASVRAGACFRDGTRVTVVGTTKDAVALSCRSEGETYAARARVVIDATGLGAPPGPAPERRRGDAAPEPASRGAPWSRVPWSRIPWSQGTSPSRVGLGATFLPGSFPLPRGELRMVVARGGYVGLVRTQDGTLNVAAAVDREVLREGPATAVDTILRDAGLPTLPGGEKGRWRGTPPLTHRPAARAGTRLFRLGDAAGYVEPFTGEGIGWSLASGSAVVSVATKAIERWRDDLAIEWEQTYARGVSRQQRVCRALSRALRHPHLVRIAVAALAKRPALATPLVLATGGVGRS